MTADEVLEHMVNGEWQEDKKVDRKIELWKLAQKSHDSDDVLNKID